MSIFKNLSCIAFFVVMPISFIDASSIPVTLDSYHAHPPIHSYLNSAAIPQGLSPDDIKAVYNLPATGGSGTIAIISAFHHKDLESDLAAFDSEFNLTQCTIKNKCLEVHQMALLIKTDSGWDMETALDSEWAHAIAPKAKILIVEAVNDGGTELMKAVDYASSRSDVVSISMSWGGDEFKGETKLDSHFISKNGKASYFASSGDDGAGASWPAASSNVISVGGTSLHLIETKSKAGKISIRLNSETAWNGSGGGVSSYESAPAYQKDYSIPRSNGMRAIPDVSFAADPMYGFSVYHNDKGVSGKNSGWNVVGGTSAGAPQWAAINSLGKGITLNTLYKDKDSASNSAFFRDIVSGKNGSCAYYCTARKRYDYVTGLGSPVTWKF